MLKYNINNHNLIFRPPFQAKYSNQSKRWIEVTRVLVRDVTGARLTQHKQTTAEIPYNTVKFVCPFRALYRMCYFCSTFLQETLCGTSIKVVPNKLTLG